MIYILDSGFGELDLEYTNPNAQATKNDHGLMLHTVIHSLNKDELIGCYELGSSPSNQDILDALAFLKEISQGGTVCMTLTVNRNEEIDSAIKDLCTNGFQFVVAGGNFGPNKNVSELTPAGLDCVTTVGSFNKSHEIASHNCSGTFNVYAPGTNINVNGQKHSGTSVATAIATGFQSKTYDHFETQKIINDEFADLIEYVFLHNMEYEITPVTKKKFESSRKGFNDMVSKIDEVSGSFCLAKWLQVTLHLQNGRNHSCHHPSTHHASLEEIAENPSAIHNTAYKKKLRKQMLEGVRPKECQYCWNVEDLPGDHISDRYIKSADKWAFKHMEKVLNAGWDEDINPTYVEVSFSNVCNFKCSYCSPIHSSQWTYEIEKEGPFELTNSSHNNLEHIKQQKSMPIHHKEENPYVDAFWKWWPNLVNDLEVFRITGGEPLLDKNTYKVLDFLYDNPQPQLEINVNSNLCVPDTNINKFLEKSKKLLAEGKVKAMQVYTSVDTHGKQAEYIRDGLSYEKFLYNMEKLLTEIPQMKISIMCTTNIMSITTFKEMLKDVYRIKLEYRNSQRPLPLILDMSILRHPRHQCLAILPASYSTHMEECLEYMLEKQENNGVNGYYEGFFDYEIKKMERCIEFMKNPPHEDENIHLPTAMADFYLFVNEHDRRRGTNFLETFPELELFYEECKAESSKRII